MRHRESVKPETAFHSLCEAIFFQALEDFKILRTHGCPPALLFADAALLCPPGMTVCGLDHADVDSLRSFFMSPLLEKFCRAYDPRLDVERLQEKLGVPEISNHFPIR